MVIMIIYHKLFTEGDNILQFTRHMGQEDELNCSAVGYCTHYTRISNKYIKSVAHIYQTAAIKCRRMLELCPRR